MILSFLFSFTAAFLSAFLDALTVTAVLISVAIGFYGVYHKVASGKNFYDDHDHSEDQDVHEFHREELDQFRSFLRSLIMHGAVGTALGGDPGEHPERQIGGTGHGWSRHGRSDEDVDRDVGRGGGCRRR